MHYIGFRNSLREFPVFSLFDARTVEPGFDRRRLNEWQAKGYIRKIINRHYVFNDVEIDEKRLFAIAGRIYRPSYVSLQTALSYYQVIPEAVYGITSVSTRRTYDFETALARFAYRTMGRKLFFGYSIIEHGAKMARLEKAILDYLYLNPRIESQEDFMSMRIDVEALNELIDRDTMWSYLNRFEQKRLCLRITHFLDWVDNA